MLWYKSWLETRWRFLIGLGILTMMACAAVLQYPAAAKLIPLAGTIDTNGPMGRLIAKAVDAQRDYRGFVWWQWYRQNLAQIGTLFALLLGSGGLLAQTTGGALFTLSLPVSRTEVLGARAATGLAEWLALAVVPSLLIPLLSPAIGQNYSVGDLLVHDACVFIVGAAFFSLALLLSTTFSDVWRPLLIACSVAVVLGIAEMVGREPSPFGIFSVMNGEVYFRTGRVPWLGLLAAASASGAMLYAAVINFARRDF
jgi:uncharacterized protein (DUF2062 family)